MEEEEKGKSAGRAATEAVAKIVATTSEMAQKNNLFRNLLDNIPDSIYLKDKEHRFIAVSKAKAEHHGVDPEDFVGKTDFDFYPEEQARKMQEDDDYVAKTKKPIVGKEEKVIRPDGTARWYSVTKIPYRDEEGNIIGSIGISRDITELKRAEEAVRESEKRYHDLIENTPVGILGIDENGTIIYENLTMRKILGVPEGEFDESLGTKLAELLNVIATGHADKVGELLKGNPVSGIVTPFVSVYGRRSLLLVDGLPLKDSEGRITGGLLMIQEITERQRAEEALRESEASYRKLADSITDVFFAMDNDLKYTYWNKASENLTRIPAKNAIGKSLYELFPDTPETRNAERVYREVLRTQQPQTFVNEYPLGGEGFFFEISAYPSKHGLSVFVKDITERQRAEEALKESEEKFRALAEQSPNMIFINKGGRVVYANKRCEEVMGYTRYEFYSADFDFLDLIAPEYRESVKTNFGKHIRGEEVEPYEFALVTKEGRRVEAIHTTRLIDYEGVKAILGIATDITQHKKAEKERIALERTAARLKALDRMKDEFLSMTSHELKTPLTSINSFLQLMRSGKLGKITRKQEEGLAMISAGIERLRGSIDKLLSISKLELGEMKLEMKNLQLADFIQNTVKKVKSLAKQKRITLAQKVAELPVIRGDGEQLTEVLANLVENAIKFTPEGGKVTVEAKREKDNILVMVKDTGIGIAKKNMPKLFTKFFQVDHSVPGTGLGLSICKKIILGHGGRIWAKSTLGRGSTFFFTLPIKK